MRGCLTPGAVYTTHIGSGVVAVRVALPASVALDAKQARSLDARLHDAVAAELAPHFRSAEGAAT